MSPTVISVEHLSKSYRLGQIGTGTFTNDLKVWWAKMRGKPNPLLRVGKTDHGNRDGEDLWALKDVSFTVEQGEVLGIIGRNGAGKSTLLKILSRVTAPTSGRIRVKGRVASLLEVGTGFHPELTGRENIYLNGAILGMNHKEIGHKFNEIVDFAEIEKFIDTPVKRYSSGMYVRLAFAVAAHLEPEILVVDEVLAVGDAEFQKKCLGKMGDVAKNGRTVLFVSHNMRAIGQLCTRALLLEKAKLSVDNAVDKVIDVYLSRVGTKRTVKRDKPVDKPMYIEEIEILDTNYKLTEKVTRHESFIVRISYVVTERTRNASIACVVSNISGAFVIDTHDTDTLAQDEIIREPGYYVTEVCIPGRLLNIGQYEILIFAGIPKLSQTFDNISNIHFIVEDVTENSIYKKSPYRRSALALELDWKTTRIVR